MTMNRMETCTVGDKVTVTRRCQWCRKESSITVDREAFDRWQRGELIQNVFPDIPKDEREILISGTHPACWDAMWEDE
jgi:hypothetical protein